MSAHASDNARTTRREGGWSLEGRDSAGRPIRLTVGDRQLAAAYPGLDIGRHPALCPLTVDDPSISRRHLRLLRMPGGLGAEDLNALNGSSLDGKPLPPFEPVQVGDGQRLALGAIVLTVRRL